MRASSHSCTTSGRPGWIRTSPSCAERSRLSEERKTGSGDHRVDSIASDVDVLAQRLDTLSKTVSTTAASLAGKEGELAALRARLEEGGPRADADVAELRASVSQLSHQFASLGDGPSDARAAPLLENQLRDLGSRVERLTEARCRLHEPGRNGRRRGGERGRPRRRPAPVREAGARIEGLSRSCGDRTSRHRLGLGTSWEREQLDLLAASVDGAQPDETVEPRLQELASRLASIEHGQHAVGLEVTRMAAAWNAERDAVSLRGEE